MGFYKEVLKDFWKGFGFKVFNPSGLFGAFSGSIEDRVDPPPAHLANPQRFGKPQNWGFIQMYAKSFCDYLEIPRILVRQLPKPQRVGSTLAYYHTVDKEICVYPYGYYTTVIKHEICHYLHHYVLGDSGFSVRAFHEDGSNASQEEYHTQSQEFQTWKEIKQWKDLHTKRKGIKLSSKQWNKIRS